MKAEIKLPFGLNENNILVHIADAKNGRKCNCICPACRNPLVAVNNGNKRQKHFRHDTDIDCKTGLESAIHLAAKQIILEKKKITLPELINIQTAMDSKHFEHKEKETIVHAGTMSFNTIEAEKDLHGMKFDLWAEKSNTPLIIEIFYRHKVDEQKKDKIFKANISAIEIDLSDLTAENVKDWDDFWAHINDPKRSRWLHNTKTESVAAKLKENLRKKIQNKEQLYKQDEIRAREQYAKDEIRFTHALRGLQNIRDNPEHISLLQEVAETHPVWQNTRKYLKHAWNDLPAFINAPVIDGDWIFGCDRRVWQSAFYSYRICKYKKKFSIQIIDGWLQNILGCKTPACAITAGILGRKYPHLAPDSFSRLPSSWRTLKSYFDHLCRVGILEYTGNDHKSSGNHWYKVVSETPQPEPTFERQEGDYAPTLPSMQPKEYQISGRTIIISPPTPGFGRRRNWRL